MKAIKWIVIIATLLLVAFALFNLELWAGEWKDLFFYMDNWWLWIGLFIFILVAKKIGAWIVQTEMRVLK